MYITPLDALYIALTIMVFMLTLPLTMILWRVYKMMDRVEGILEFIDRLVWYGKELEKIPLSIIERFAWK